MYSQRSPVFPRKMHILSNVDKLSSTADLTLNVSAKEPCIRKRALYPQRSPMNPQKSRMYPQKIAMYL